MRIVEKETKGQNGEVTQLTADITKNEGKFYVNTVLTITHENFFRKQSITLTLEELNAITEAANQHVVFGPQTITENFSQPS